LVLLFQQSNSDAGKDSTRVLVGQPELDTTLERMVTPPSDQPQAQVIQNLPQQDNYGDYGDTPDTARVKWTEKMARRF